MLTPNDTIYVHDRKLLESIGGLSCTDTTITFNDTTAKGESIFISIRNKHFSPTNHTLDLADTTYKFIHNEKRVDHLIVKNLIDGKEAFGIDGVYPKVEISQLKIQWNGTWLSIPDSAFHNLYETHLCLDYRPVEAYLTKDNKHLYIYIAASDGIGSYAVKLVFSRNQYLTRIVNRNEMTDGFNFLDATANEE